MCRRYVCSPRQDHACVPCVACVQRTQWAPQLLRALPWMATNKAIFNLVQDQSQIWEGGEQGEGAPVSHGLSHGSFK